MMQGGANLLRRGKSIHYAYEDDEDPQRSTSTVFASNFMLKFTAQLTDNIKQFVREDSKMSAVGHSLSSSNIKDITVSPSRMKESSDILPKNLETGNQSSKSAGNLLRHDIN